jgi:hypothetical protein
MQASFLNKKDEPETSSLFFYQYANSLPVGFFCGIEAPFRFESGLLYCPRIRQTMGAVNLGRRLLGTGVEKHPDCVMGSEKDTVVPLQQGHICGI